MKGWLAAAMVLVGSAAHATPSPSIPHFSPHFPVFGGGKLVNIFDDEQALTNASSHVGWALSLPLAGQYFGGRKGLWIVGLSWIAFTLTQESLFHAPKNPGPAYPSEVRADLLTRIVPTLALLAWDLTHPSRAQADAAQRGAEPPRPPLRVDAPATGPSQPWRCPDVAVPTRVATGAGRETP